MSRPSPPQTASAGFIEGIILKDLYWIYALIGFLQKKYKNVRKKIGASRSTAPPENPRYSVNSSKIPPYPYRKRHKTTRIIQHMLDPLIYLCAY
jgi:hypothetical protein